MFTYGPVPSRRLGRSLGVSIIPRKVCSYSCVYCQLGPTRVPRIEPASYFDKDVIFAEIESRIARTAPDYITFVGDGEPTLSSDLGWYIDQCKARFATPVAVITNGSLLYRADVRESLLAADTVLPSLDGGDARTFAAMNRPHRDLDFQQVVAGLVAFRQVFRGQIWLEVMLVKGINDSEPALRKIRECLRDIRPDRVDIAIPTRPPTEAWVEPPERAQITLARRILRSAEWMVYPETGSFDVSGLGSLLEAIQALSSRHPLRWDQAREIADLFGGPDELDRLIRIGALMIVEYGDTRFVEVQESTPSPD